MRESLLSPPEIETPDQHYPLDEMCHDETPPSLWQRLLQVGNREVFTSLSGVLTLLCLILAFQTLAGILVVYASVSGVPQDLPDATVSTQYADSCVRALTDTLAKERSAHLIR
jgi:hypothetical protein